jgi:hypothetical protein
MLFSIPVANMNAGRTLPADSRFTMSNWTAILSNGARKKRTAAFNQILIGLRANFQSCALIGRRVEPPHSTTNVTLAKNAGFPMSPRLACSR